MIAAEEIQKDLNCRRFGKKIFSFQSIDSTNNRARVLAVGGEREGTLVVAEEQTAGRGRQGRTWVASAGENLMFSLILRPGIPPDKLNILPLGIAVAVAHGVQRFTSLPVYCKWPNDLLLHGRKFAGILMESALNTRGFEYVIVGIGVNVNQETFPDPLQQRATSLALHAGHHLDRIGLLRAILESLEKEYDSYDSGGIENILPSWLALAPIIGKRITAEMQGVTVSGTVSGISSGGGLQLHTDAGDLTLLAGDVTILDMESYAPRN